MTRKPPLSPEDAAAYRLLTLAAIDQLRAAQLRLAQVEAQRDALRDELRRYCAERAR